MFNPANPQLYRVNTNTIIAETNYTLNGVEGDIQSLSIYDPINASNQVAFVLVTTTGAYAVVEANAIPVLAVTRLSQGDPNWKTQLYANGSVNSNVAINDGGTGYTSSGATVSFSAPQTPGGITAQGSAEFVGGVLTGVQITNPGSGYTSAPTITITGGEGRQRDPHSTRLDAGCTLTALTADLNYVGYPNLSYVGHPTHL